MATQTKYYSMEEFAEERIYNGTGPRIPPQANFLAAVNHIRDLFEHKKFLYGMAGGFEMLCLGYRREMPDLHMVYDDKDYVRIKKKLEADRRILLPDGMNPLFPFKVLVRTGPAYQDLGCHEVATIEVNMIPPGSCGSPPSGTLNNNLVLVTLKRDAQLKSYKGLNMHYLLHTMLHLATARDIAWDPRKDVLFLCQHYGDEVQASRAKLDAKLVQRNFLGTAFFSRLSRDDQRNCYQVLLGKEPPPLMWITPPAPPYGHARSVSESAIPKPRSSVLQPALETKKQKTPALLSPPLQIMPKSSRKDSLIAGSEPEQTIAALKLDTSEPPASRRYARSRYRSTSANNIKTSNTEGTLGLQSIPRPLHAEHVYSGKVHLNGEATRPQTDRIEASGTPLPAPFRSTIHLVSSTGDSTCHRQHTMDAERHSEKPHLVGIGGLRATQKVERLPSHSTTTESVGPERSLAKAFQLDAPSQVQDTMTELSDAIEVALQVESHKLTASRFSLNELFIDQDNEQPESRPEVPRVQSAPECKLPASLMAGRGTTQYFQSAAPENASYLEAVKTNASRYSRYYSQPDARLGSNDSSPQTTPPALTTYKAYQPTVLLSSQPAPLSACAHKRSASFETLKDVSGADHYFQIYQRSHSDGSQSSHTLHDSHRLAAAYQADLPKYEDGYGTSN
ncbi:hypothetical protein NX059_000476 [Plenodomus lindquistii]|nr:hypothetical protein NX059_000476 [Plenodomus lindquistii]